MSKAVLISIRPKWVEKIASGKKTIEVRKTQPKLDTPFKCYIYCSKAKERLIGILKDGDENYGEIYHGKPVFIKQDEGSVCDMWGNRQKVIGEFTCDRIVPITYDGGRLWCPTNAAFSPATCLSQAEIIAYIGDKGRCYGWHISDLLIYDQPRELTAFRRACKNSWYCESCAMYWENNGTCGNKSLQIHRPPQSWCYVEAMKDD